MIEELDTLIKQNPRLGFKSTAEASQHAIVFFTEELRKRLGQHRLDPKNPPPLDELMGFIEHYYAERRDKQAPPPSAKRGRQP